MRIFLMIWCVKALDECNNQEYSFLYQILAIFSIFLLIALTIYLVNSTCQKRNLCCYKSQQPSTIVALTFTSSKTKPLDSSLQKQITPLSVNINELTEGSTDPTRQAGWNFSHAYRTEA